jgi:hypothetical protein
MNEKLHEIAYFVATSKLKVSIAQSVERKTEDLEAACSIHARDKF